MKTVFQIGPCRFAIDSDIEIRWAHDFLKFIISDETDLCPVYTLRAVSGLPQPCGERILSRADVEIWNYDGEEIRYYRLGGNPWFFAMGQGRQIYYWKPCENLLQQNRILFSLLSLEQMILQEGCILLHASFIEYSGTAVLFSAPSGTGKSTQADLWHQYRGAKIVNGDRSLLCRTENGWEAYGWPFSGSSPFCENVHAPLKAIVYLEQHGEDIIRRCPYPEAVRKLFSEVTVNRWNPVFTNRALDLVENLARSVPFYHLRCTKSEDAVRCLEEALFHL